MTKEVLSQYSDLQEEIKEVRKKIAKLQDDLEKIENGESVIDTVSGGMGGTQHFKIEGVPYPEYGRKRTLLYSRMTTLQLLQDDLLEKTNDVEEFIASLDDSRMRRIINFRFLENKSWLQTAYALGGKATADAEDLNICDTNAFTYLLTYSFPCTDLSVAGKQAGMSKGSGTRSSLLWEVERILTEIRDSNGELPQILFMENVPQVHSQDNMPDFRKWLDFLESLGYTNYYQDLNAKNYGVAQNRERCFMFSFLGEYNYHFPQPIPLKKKLKDYLEDNVDEKYYINNEKADKLIKQLIDNGTLPQHNLDRQTDRQTDLR